MRRPVQKKRLLWTAVAFLAAAAGVWGVAVAGRPVPAASNGQCVILMHGLMRSSRSMAHIAKHLRRSGYTVINLDYPSTEKTIAAVAEQHLAPQVARCRGLGYDRIHVVTHSLGGRVVQNYLQRHRLPPGSRVVMLAPPSRGSELADLLEHSRLFYRLAGPAGPALATVHSAGRRRLHADGIRIGVIAGSATVNPVLSCLIPGPDDGKVAVARTAIASMSDFLVVPSSHVFMIWRRPVLDQIAFFLACGRFYRTAPD